jgi:DNA-binding NarL/FixJ family response regulator
MLNTLIVEDSPIFRKTFREALCERFPFLVIEEASRGEDGLEKFESCHPALVFMDVRLPGMSGLELTRRMKESRPETVVVILTAYDFPEYKDTAFRSGADAFIPKDSLNMGEIGVLLECAFPETSLDPSCPNEQAVNVADGGKPFRV